MRHWWCRRARQVLSRGSSPRVRRVSTETPPLRRNRSILLCVPGFLPQTTGPPAETGETRNHQTVDDLGPTRETLRRPLLTQYDFRSTLSAQRHLSTHRPRGYGRRGKERSPLKLRVSTKTPPLRRSRNMLRCVPSSRHFVLVQEESRSKSSNEWDTEIRNNNNSEEI